MHQIILHRYFLFYVLMFIHFLLQKIEKIRFYCVYNIKINNKQNGARYLI